MYKSLIFIMLLLELVSCKRECPCDYRDAVINWTGDYATDGCGFFISIDSLTFKPDNEADIPDEFKGSNLNVAICYTEEEKQVPDNCYTAEPTYTDRIHVLSIKRR